MILLHITCVVMGNISLVVYSSHYYDHRANDNYEDYSHQPPPGT